MSYDQGKAVDHVDIDIEGKEPGGLAESSPNSAINSSASAEGVRKDRGVLAWLSVNPFDGGRFP
jgi:hypothetical protein